VVQRWYCDAWEANGALGIDTSTLAGQLILGVFSQIAEWDKKMLKEKQKAGIAAAKRRGKHLGRKAEGYTKTGMEKAILKYLAGESVNSVCSEYNIPRSSFYAKLKEAGIKRQ
jgi:DNA invertase Pin-like site-specific DNA recombinase